MIKNRQLKDIATISAGYTFRGAITHSDEGNIYVLQAKNISKNDYFTSVKSLTRVSMDIPRSNSYIKDNDVLLTSRGSSNFKATVYKANDKKIVASSSVNIIRIKDTQVLPEFLALYLNSSEGQLKLSQIVSGNYIKSLLRKNLEEIKIPIPAIEKQKAMIALNENMRRQEKILERRSQINKNIMSASLRNLITS